eukprot:jgi/Mesen1/8883/ME000532S08272
MLRAGFLPLQFRWKSILKARDLTTLLQFLNTARGNMSPPISSSRLRMAGYLNLVGVFLNIFLTTLVLYILQHPLADAVRHSASETRSLAEHLTAEQQQFMQQQAAQQQASREQQQALLLQLLQQAQAAASQQQGLPAIGGQQPQQQHTGPINPQRQEVGPWNENVKPKVSKTGAWNITADYLYITDKSLALKLGEVFGRDTQVLELGAGKGHYTIVLEGVAPWELRGDTWQAGGERLLELAQVGEHIPADYMLQFIDNIDRHNTKGVILSWAVLGQGGQGHVNCRSNEFVKGLFGVLGYTNDMQTEAALRASATHGYFKNSLMVMRKK